MRVAELHHRFSDESMFGESFRISRSVTNLRTPESSFSTLRYRVLDRKCMYAETVEKVEARKNFVFLIFALSRERTIYTICFAIIIIVLLLTWFSTL